MKCIIGKNGLKWEFLESKNPFRVTAMEHEFRDEELWEYIGKDGEVLLAFILEMPLLTTGHDLNSPIEARPHGYIGVSYHDSPEGCLVHVGTPFFAFSSVLWKTMILEIEAGGIK